MKTEERATPTSHQREGKCPEGKHPESLNSQGIILSALEEDLLTLLEGKSLYGLEIMDAINAVGQQRRKLRTGSLYTTLHRMEQKDLVLATWGEEEDGRSGGARRKYYKATELGRAVLQETQDYRENLSAWLPAKLENSVTQTQSSISK
jgi:PadR family transcriptional regulator PadR